MSSAVVSRLRSSREIVRETDIVAAPHEGSRVAGRSGQWLVASGQKRSRHRCAIGYQATVAIMRGWQRDAASPAGEDASAPSPAASPPCKSNDRRQSAESDTDR